MFLGQKLRALREIKELTQDDLGKIAGVSTKTIQRYEMANNNNGFNINTIRKIANSLGVALETLLIDEAEISTISAKPPAREALDPSQSPMLAIPYFKNYYAAAGSGAINYEERPEIISFNAAFLESKLNTKNTAGIHVINSIGDSMYPTIKAGELLFIMPFANEYNRLKDGSIYIINTPQGVLVKRVRLHPVEQKITLVSDNKSVGEIELRGDELESLLIIGRVVGHFAFF